jgi:hypothetical protein
MSKYVLVPLGLLLYLGLFLPDERDIDLISEILFFKSLIILLGLNLGLTPIF